MRFSKEPPMGLARLRTKKLVRDSRTVALRRRIAPTCLAIFPANNEVIDQAFTSSSIMGSSESMRIPSRMGCRTRHRLETPFTGRQKPSECVSWKPISTSSVLPNRRGFLRSVSRKLQGRIRSSVIIADSGFARPSKRIAMASPPQMSFAPLSPKRRHRRIIGSVACPSSVPSHPSIGWHVHRFPMVRPATRIGWRSTDCAPSIASSHWRSMPSSSIYARNSSTLAMDLIGFGLIGLTMIFLSKFGTTVTYSSGRKMYNTPHCQRYAVREALPREGGSHPTCSIRRRVPSLRRYLIPAVRRWSPREDQPLMLRSVDSRFFEQTIQTRSNPSGDYRFHRRRDTRGRMSPDTQLLRHSNPPARNRFAARRGD